MVCDYIIVFLIILGGEKIMKKNVFSKFRYFTRFTFLTFVSIVAFAISTVYAQIVEAKTIIISDLDDTVRIANIRNPVNAARLLLAGVRPFEALKYIYQDIEQQHKERNKIVKFYYLSGSKKIFYNAQKWLDENQFPKGVVIQKKLSGSGDTASFKKEKIREILKQENINEDTSANNLVYFFGDDGEYDPEVYTNIVEEIKLQKANTFIFIRDVIAEYTSLDPKIPVLTNDAINYFFTELDLVKVPQSSEPSASSPENASQKNPLIAVKKETLEKINKDTEERLLIPEFMFKEVMDKVSVYICESSESLLRKVGTEYNHTKSDCLKNKKAITQEIIENYYKRY